MCLGIPGRIVRITDAGRCLAVVNVSGVEREVNVACVSPDDEPMESLVGQWVLLHVGFALSRIDEDEATKTLELLDRLGEVQSELTSMQQSGVS